MTLLSIAIHGRVCNLGSIVRICTDVHVSNPGAGGAEPERAKMTEEIFRNDAYVKTCDARVVAVDERGIQLDRTVFYPMGGGQPGDQGVLRLESGRAVEIVDTRKGEAPGRFLHIPQDRFPRRWWSRRWSPRSIGSGAID